MELVKHKGKRIKDGKWVVGFVAEYKSTFLNKTSTQTVIFDNISSFLTDNYSFVISDLEVHRNSIRKGTNYYDINGNQIFIGDSVKFVECDVYGKVIEFKDRSAQVCFNENIKELCACYDNIVIVDEYDSEN